MKKIILLFLLIQFGINCFCQDLVITSTDYDGEISIQFDKGNWPISNQVRTRWDNILKKYNLISLESDPFNPNILQNRIIDMVKNAVEMPWYGRSAYTIYFTMGNKRYICLMYSEYLDSSRWYWIFEVK